MADTVDVTSVFSGSHRHVLHLTNESDGTGESAVTKLDISTLTGPTGAAPSSVTLLEARWSVQGFSYVVLEWDATTNDEMLVCSGNDYASFEAAGGKADPGSTGSTGDVVLTTDGGADGSSYDITLVFRLEE